MNLTVIVVIVSGVSVFLLAIAHITQYINKKMIRIRQ